MDQKAGSTKRAGGEDSPTRATSERGEPAITEFRGQRNIDNFIGDATGQPGGETIGDPSGKPGSDVIGGAKPGDAQRIAGFGNEDAESLASSRGELREYFLSLAVLNGNFLGRIVRWNGCRYPQVHSQSLTEELLEEEIEEFRTAETLVDKVDALVDGIYIAVGAMWKLGLTEDQIKKCIVAVCDANDSKSIAKTEPDAKYAIDKGPDFKSPEVSIAEIIYGKGQNCYYPRESR